MLPYNAYAFVALTAILAVIPVATTYPGVDVPPWVGLLLAIVSAAAGVVLKQMAPATDVHKDSELPPAPKPPTLQEIADEIERRRRERVERRLRGGDHD